VTGIGSIAWLQKPLRGRLLPATIYQRLTRKSAAASTVREVIPLEPCMSADDETDFQWLMKIPDHVRWSVTTSHADGAPTTDGQAADSCGD